MGRNKGFKHSEETKIKMKKPHKKKIKIESKKITKEEI